jgi:hypothetical protein
LLALAVFDRGMVIFALLDFGAEDADLSFKLRREREAALT